MCVGTLWHYPTVHLLYCRIGNVVVRECMNVWLIDYIACLYECVMTVCVAPHFTMLYYTRVSYAMLALVYYTTLYCIMLNVGSVFVRKVHVLYYGYRRNIIHFTTLQCSEYLNDCMNNCVSDQQQKQSPPPGHPRRRILASGLCFVRARISAPTGFVIWKPIQRGSGLSGTPTGSDRFGFATDIP
jgi:hypothetical protein